MAFTKIDGFIIDATPLEDHQFETEVTDHPVEEGADISDHARIKPFLLTLDCVVSNTPLAAVFPFRSSDLPSDDCYAHLQQARKEKRLLKVETSLDIFENMEITRLSIARKADDGFGIRFQISFKQIEIVTNERSIVQVAVPRAAKKQAKGKKATKDVTSDKAEDKKRYKDSWGGQVLEAFTGPLGEGNPFDL